MYEYLCKKKEQVFLVYRFTDSENELYHYGVKGMKWGVRRIPEQLGYRKNNHVDSGEYSLSKYKSPTGRKVANVAKLVAVNTLAAFIPGFATVYNLNVARMQLKYNLDKKDYVKKEGEYEKLSDLKKKTSKTDVIDDLKYANPRIGNQKGKVNNCTYCTLAMEMRARGYDVQARSKGQGAVTEKLYDSMFENFKMSYSLNTRKDGESRKDFANRSYNDLCNKIENYGNGTRGYVGVRFENARSGHAMYWRVENNRVTFYDGQSGKANPDNVFGIANPSVYSYARLDNLPLKETITEAVVSRREKGEKK